MYGAAMASLLSVGLLGMLLAVAAKRWVDRQWSPRPVHGKRSMKTSSWGQTAVCEGLAANSRRELRRVTRPAVAHGSHTGPSGGIGGRAPDVNAGCSADWSMCSPSAISVRTTSVAHGERPSRGGLLRDRAEGGRHAPQAPAGEATIGRALHVPALSPLGV